MKINRYHCILFLILLFGCLIRFNNLDKPTGLWYDEITIYSIASSKTLSGMLSADIHRFLLFPLYYIIYHFWLTIWGNSDFLIRCMSVFCDILSLICTFFVGKYAAKSCDCDENRTGLIYFTLYSINSLLIYYSQEAKFYSLSLLFINLILLFWIKYIKNPSKNNFILFYFFNFTLILTYTSQCLFVLLMYFITIIYFLKNKIKINQKQIFIFPSMFIPIIWFSYIVPNYFSGNFDAVSFDLSFILVLIQNFFSPILNSLQNNLTNYVSIFLLNIFKLPFLIFVLFPIVYMFYALIKSLKETILSKYLFILGISYILIHLLLTLTTNYNVLVRYLILVLPIFLLICSIGISKQKKLFTFIIYVCICLVILISPYSSTKIPRPDGYKQLGEILKSNEVPQAANFILPIRTNLLDKYYYIEGNRYSLYALNNEEFQKTYLTKEEIDSLKTDKHKAYKQYFENMDISEEFDKLVYEKFIKYGTCVIITDKTISMWNNEQIKAIAESNKYENSPIQVLRLSKLNNDLISVFQKYMKLTTKFENNTWAIYVFSK